MGKITDTWLAKLIMLVGLTIWLTVLICLLPFAYVYYKTRNVILSGFGWLTTEP